MNENELGRLLSGAFDAQARDAVDDSTPPPAPRFAQGASPAERQDTEAFTVDGVGPVERDELGARRASRPPLRGVRLVVPLAAAAAVVVLLALVLTVLGRDPGGSTPSAANRTPGVSVPPTMRGTGKPVHIKLLNADGSKVGVGMPVIAYFSARITDARALQQVTSVTVNGKAEHAAWYFEPSKAMPHYPYEAHLRLHEFWPANARIHVAMPTNGLTAGRALRFDDSLTLDFRTGPADIATVNQQTHLLRLSSDGVVTQYRVSLGAKHTPTLLGVKVIMQKLANGCTGLPHNRPCASRYAQRLTYTGEFLTADLTNRKNILAGRNSSGGSTDLLTKNAATLYDTLRVGDVVKYVGVSGPQMHLGQGYGDWNVSWAQWLTGGAVPTR